MRYFILSTFFLSISICSTAQNSLLSKDQITLNKLKVFELNMESIIENFGQPQSIQDFFFEMSNKQGKKILYKGFLIYILNNKVKSFEITSEQYSLTEHEITIGYHLNAFKELFPESFKNKKENSLSITLKEYDKYITFYLDKEQKIRLIRMGDY